MQMEEDAVGRGAASRTTMRAGRPPPWLRLAAAATTHGHSMQHPVTGVPVVDGARHLDQLATTGVSDRNEASFCVAWDRGTSDGDAAGLSMADWPAAAHAAPSCQ